MNQRSASLCPRRLPRSRRLREEHGNRSGPDGWCDLVVAATDGPMPQTREHILACSSGRGASDRGIHEQG